VAKVEVAKREGGKGAAYGREGGFPCGTGGASGTGAPCLSSLTLPLSGLFLRTAGRILRTGASGTAGKLGQLCLRKVVP